MEYDVDLSPFYEMNYEGEKVVKNRPQTESFTSVKNCIKHNKGRRPEVVDKFIKFYQDGIAWDWFEEFQMWTIRCLHYENLSDQLTPDPLTGEMPDRYVLPPMPTRQPDRTAELREYEREIAERYA